MAHFPAIQLTKTGKQMIGESQGNAKLIFVRAELGDGQLSEGEDVEAFTGLKHSVMSAPLQNFLDKGNGEVRLRFSVSNRDVTNGFMNREIGIFAKLDDGEAKLYAYTNAGNFADYIPSKEVPIDSEIIDVHIIVAGAKNVTAVISDEAYVTRKTFEEHNTDPNAHPNLGLQIRKNSTAYAVGDIAYSRSLPSWARLECVKAGTTAATDDEIKNIVSKTGGVMVHDGTVTWIIDDIRDCTPIGTVRGSLYLPAGYIKANGATVQRVDYPRLVAWVEANNLWTDDVAANAGLFGRGDGATTMTVPNWIDRMAQFATSNIGASVAAGLPNITGKFGVIDASGGGLEHLEGGFPRSDVSVPSNFTRRGTALDLISPGVNVYFDASRSNPIYGASATVQPAAIKVIPIIRY